MGRLFYLKLWLLCFTFIYHQNTVKAQCEIWDMTVITECHQNQILFDAEINFNHQNTSDSFKVVGNGNEYGTFAYSQLPITLAGLEANCNTIYEFVAKDKITPTCSDFVVSGQICCNTGPCEIAITDFSTSNCISGDLVDVTFNLSYSNTSNLGFDVFDQNGFVAFYNYNQLPVTISNFTAPLDQHFIFIQVCDNDNPNCCDVLEFENPCYMPLNCEIWNMTAISECYQNENLFDVEINFDYINTSDSFCILGNGVNYGCFSYSQLPLTLAGLDANCNTNYEFVAKDKVTQTCSDFFELGPVCCNNAPCEIAITDFSTSNCISGDLIDVSFNLSYSNTSNLGFDVFDQNGFVAFYNYNQLPVTISDFSAPLDQHFIFIQVCDNDNPNCCDILEFENPCYAPSNCEIWNMTVSSECHQNQNLFDAEINFEHLHTSDSFFIVGNGINYGYFSYSQLPITLTGLEANCNTNYEFVVKDKVTQTCSDFFELGPVCCNNATCEIWDMTGIIECHANQNLFDIEIDFNHSNTSDSFRIIGNGVNYGTFAYADLPVTLPGLSANCTTNYEFGVTDIVTQSCSDFIDLGPICCESMNCEISITDFESSTCINGNLLNISFDLIYSNTSNVGFDVFDQNGFVAFYNYNQLPLTITDFEAAPDQHFLYVIVCDNDNLGCCDTLEFENPCYNPGQSCDIDSLTAEVISCSNGLFDLNINFNFTNTSDSFYIQGNGINYGLFAYANLPIVLTGLNADCNTIYELVVIDSDFQNCSEAINIGEVCCENFNNIVTSNMSTINMSSGNFNLGISIIHNLLANCYFEIFLNGNSVDTLYQLDSFLLIENLECIPNNTYQIVFFSPCLNNNALTLSVDVDDLGCLTNTTNINEQSGIYFNTNSKMITIYNKNQDNLQLEIFDVLGRNIFKEEVMQSYWMKEMSTFEPSVYFLILSNSDNNIHKILKVFVE